MTNLTYSHPRNYGKDSRHCRVCHTTRGLIRKYHLNMCRRCFRERATDIGFVKVRFVVVVPCCGVSGRVSNVGLLSLLCDAVPVNALLAGLPSHDGDAVAACLAGRRPARAQAPGGSRYASGHLLAPFDRERRACATAGTSRLAPGFVTK